MKRMNVVLFAFLAFLSRPVRADDVSTTTVPVPLVVSTPAVTVPVAIDTATPQAVLSLVDGLHPLDNATPATFRDNINGEWLWGATTAIYKKWYVSADTGWAAPLDNNQHGLYLIGGRFYFGQLLVEQVPILRALPSHSIVTTSLIKYLAAGIWGARDFGYSKWRAGEYIGIEVKLDYLNWLSHKT